jgi:hypothetical protein
MIKLPNIKGLALIAKGFTMAHRPELLFGVSVASTLGAVGLAAKGGYEARGILDEKVVGAPIDVDVIPVKEKIQLTWLCYAPAAVATITSVGSTTGLHLVHVQEKKALAQAALAAIEEVRTEAKEYSDRLIAAVEENVDEKTAGAIADDALDPNKDGVVDACLINDSDHAVKELYLVRDAKTGRDIWSNELQVEEAANQVNSCIAKQGDCELNTFYSLAGFENTPDGDDWGWSGDFVELKWDATIRDDGRPVKRFAFRTQPKKGYDRGGA